MDDNTESQGSSRVAHMQISMTLQRPTKKKKRTSFQTSRRSLREELEVVTFKPVVEGEKKPWQSKDVDCELVPV